ncbi:hypothetical protein A3D71_00465 [Candidatus Kaiserbacteria bacterium RIFCSPHIGHO2_02_FULL_55_20]|uniref:Uncharacterized protein n=1 Tax=Candidatus Kaiserbacteria bacterium RIFCSPHIGHO2_02_FULL_55_20 TaxID=1798497 RepID=A0A1F6DWT6_9BACT|nr:MAG: hypothetical protein A3D71_00465 [Candidatus Kaiserbacteria bacterium RIFCSPHIGHO2_02_FULL_55_20]
MDAEVNGYHLAIEGQLRQGCARVKRKSIMVGVDGGSSLTLDLAEGPDGSLPRCEGTNLLEGAPFQIPNGPRYIGGRGKWQGALLRISTFNLEFSPDLSGHFGMIENGWPGAETLRPPFVQLGRRRNADQHQLVAVADGKHIFVADRGSRYIKVTCKGGVLTGAPAEKAELGRLLVRRAQMHSDDPNLLRWTWHTLRRLELLGLWSGPVAQKLTERMKEWKPGIG